MTLHLAPARPRRQRIAALLALATMVAATMVAGATEHPIFEAVRVPGSTGFEQGINLLPGGIIYVDEPPGLPGHGRLWKSTDNGASFTQLSFPSPWGRFPGGGDTDVVLSHDDRVYFLDLWGGANAVTVSKDGGQTWAQGNPIVGVPTSDRQWIGLGERDELLGEDTVYVIYSKLFVQPDWTYIARSRDGGLTWTYHAPIVWDVPVNDDMTAVGEGSPQGPTGNLVTDGTFLAFTWEDAGRMWAAYSSDEGETWSRSFIGSGADNNIPSIALDGNNLHVTYVSSDNRTVMVATSTNRGATWSDPKAVATGGTSVFSWVAARDGKVGVAWYTADAEVPTPDDLPAEDFWHVRYVESVDNGDTFTAPVLVASDVKKGPICTQGLNCNTTGSGGREVGDFIALEIGYDGMTSIAHYAARGPQGWVSRQVRPVEEA